MYYIRNCEPMFVQKAIQKLNIMLGSIHPFFFLHWCYIEGIGYSETKMNLARFVISNQLEWYEQNLGSQFLLSGS